MQSRFAPSPGEPPRGTGPAEGCLSSPSWASRRDGDAHGQRAPRWTDLRGCHTAPDKLPRGPSHTQISARYNANVSAFPHVTPLET